MNFIESFYAQIMKVFSDGVFGISLGDIAIIFISIILSLLIRGAVANILVNKVKKIVSKTGNKIDDKLFEALVPPFRLLPIVIVFLAITLYFDIESTLGLYFQKINNKVEVILDLTETDYLNYHNGARFTIFSKNVRGEVARGGRYQTNNGKKIENSTGFNCYMDTIIRASTYKENIKKLLE